MASKFTRVAVAGDQGRRLDAYLAAQPEVGSRAAARRLLDGGQVFVSGRRAKPATTLLAGDRKSVV